MAASKARSVAGDRQHKSRSHDQRKRLKARDTAHSSATNKPTLDQLRDARAAYFGRPTEERIKRAQDSVHDHSTRDTVTKSSRLDLSSRRTKTHRRHGSSGDYVYSSREYRLPGPDSINDSTRSETTRDRKPEDGRVYPKRDTTESKHKRRAGKDVIPGNQTVSSETSEIGSGKSSSRPKLSRGSTTPLAQASRTGHIVVNKRDSVISTAGETASVSPSKKAAHRSSSLLTSLFRSNSTPSVAKARQVECLTCGADDVPATKAAKLGCGHRMCHSCLKRIFTMSVADPIHMPPRCCQSDHIPLRYVENLFSTNFKVLWNKKYQEYTTKNRLYCPARGCGEWVKPSNIHSDQGRKYGRCSKCRAKVCVLCNSKWHTKRECPGDEETNKLIETAKEQGWQRCFNCKAMIELKEGCNHMTCRCTAEFCMLCGSKWKSCDCPWFNYTSIADADRLRHMRVPFNIIRRRAEHDNDNGQAQARPFPHNPALTYQQELEARRRQERTDEALARRMQLAAIDLEPEDSGDPRPQRNPMHDVWGIGNAGTHFMNEDFVQRATNVVMAAFGEEYGRRGERESGRRRRRTAVQSGVNADSGLAPNAFGDESVLGLGPAVPAATVPARNGTSKKRASGPSTQAEAASPGDGPGGRIGEWLNTVR